MIAASVWSLLIPAIEEAEARGQLGWLPAAGGFILGIAFLYGLDKLIPICIRGQMKLRALLLH
jgi:ZIP family zinc transporter